MKSMRFRHLLCGISLASAALISGCEPVASTPSSTSEPSTPSIESNATTLSLRSTRLSDGRVAVDLHYMPHSGQVAPRMLELRLGYSANLTFVESQPLAALDAAHKQLVVQESGEGQLRLMAFASDNLLTLGAGPLARIIFDAPSSGRVEILSSQATFAPAESNVGVTFGEAIQIGGTP